MKIFGFSTHDDYTDGYFDMQDLFDGILKFSATSFVNLFAAEQCKNCGRYKTKNPRNQNTN